MISPAPWKIAGSRLTFASAWMCAAAGLWMTQAPGLGQTVSVELFPRKDNTLYEIADGSLSNALGNFIFCGRSGQGDGRSVRRALIDFDLTLLPPGAIVLGAELRLYMNQTIAGDTEVTLHLLETDWGAQSSNAATAGGEGTGVDAGEGDATWRHTFYDAGDPAASGFWQLPGGDFACSASAAAVVGATPGFYSWTGPRLLGDVQAWIDGVLPNFGWIVMGDESTQPTAKRFVSRENIDFTRRPRLVLTYTTGVPAPPPPLPADARMEFGGAAGDDVRLYFQSMAGCRYYLEKSPDLDCWRPVVSANGVSGTGAQLFLEDPGARQSEGVFYRVLVMPEP